MTPEVILARLPIWQKAPRLVRLDKGRTNRNFIIHDGEARYFGRVGADLPHHGISRTNEHRCAELAAARGVAPPVHHAAEGVLVTHFVEGETLDPAAMHDAPTLRQVARLLRRLHAEPIEGTGLVPRCGVSTSRDYLRELPDSELPVGRARILDRLGPPSAGGDRLVHSDIIPENLMRGADGLQLIDWEYGGSGIPEVDLGSVIANADLTPEESDSLLDAYGPHDPTLVERQRVALVVREALWCLVQMRHGGPEGDLVPYARSCIARMLREFP